MRLGHLALVLGASLAGAACSSSAAPQQHTDIPPASPAVAAEKLGGFWLFTIQRGGQSIDHSLHIALTAGELVGSLTGPDGNARELSKIALKGDKVSWEIQGQDVTQNFEGTLKNSSMQGTIKMSRGRHGGKSGGQSGDDGSASPPTDDGQPPGGRSGGRGGGYGGRGGRGGGRGGGHGGVEGQTTWRAFKSVEPQLEMTPTPAKTGRVPSLVQKI